MKVPEIKSYSLSRGHSVFRRSGLSLEAIHQSSGSSFSGLLSKDHQEKLTTLVEPLYTTPISQKTHRVHSRST